MRAEGQARTQATKDFFRVGGKGAAVAGVAKALRDVTMDVAGYGSTHAPIKYGFLRASVHDEDIAVVDVGGRVMLRGQVDATQPYAYIQHEHSEFNHPKGGEDHYISNRLDAMGDKYQASIADELAKALEGAK